MRWSKKNSIHKAKYNILEIASFSLGYVHIEVSLVKEKSCIVSKAIIGKMKKRVQIKDTIAKIKNAIGIKLKS